ncbi:MAG: hypothetical protein ACWA5R_03645 [bacterium]
MPWNPLPANVQKMIPDINLANDWPVIHRGDCEPFPDLSWIEQTRQSCPEIDSELNTHEFSSEDAANMLQSAWLAYHQGRFGDAVELADQMGHIATTVKSKAAGIYTDYLEDDEQKQLSVYEQLALESETSALINPNHANNYYFQAFGFGRYSQGISIAKALTQGLGGKIRKSLDLTLELQPEHAEAHLALALYHAEVVDKIGRTMAKLTYGASANEAYKHFEQALNLCPDFPIVHIEYGNGLMLLEGDSALDKANEAYTTAAELKAIDAMSALDIDFARSEI